jgi:hypothetical protein
MRGFGRRAAAAALLVAIAVGLVSCGSSSSKKAAGVTGASEVTASAVNTAGANPFTPAVGKDKAGVRPPPAAASSSGGLPTYTANLPGLYGGTRNYATCDATQLVTFLEQNPGKATAWATTLGISTSSISSYVSGLTPVILRTDTRVTNHGYVNGVADAIQSVLEAGTAVFVNRYGEPVVKCYCGNPLTPPVLYSAPTYVGPLWTGFQTTSITIINQSTTIINVFKLYDPTTGELFTRPAGTSGRTDGPYLSNTPTTTTTTTQPQPTTPTTTTPAPQPTTPTTPTTPPQPARNPVAGFSPSSGTVADSYSIGVSGFRPNASLDLALTRPDGGVEHYSMTTDSHGTSSYSFPHVNNPLPGTYSAVVSDPQTGDSASASVNVSP